MFGLTLKNAHMRLLRLLTLSVSLAVTLNSLAVVGHAQSILPPVQDVSTAPAMTKNASSSDSARPASTPTSASTSSTETEALSQLEVQVLGASSPKLPLTQRIEQLESVVFGEAQTGTLSAREAQLLKMIESPSASNNSTSTPNSTDDIARQMQDGFRPYQSAPPATQIPEVDNPPAASSAPTGQRHRSETDYPTVTALEQQVFRQSYVSDDITQRLNRLEQQVFGRPNQAMALVDRVDRLVTQVPVVASQPARVYPDTTPMFERPARAPVQSRPAAMARAPVKPSPLDSLPTSADQLTNGQIGIYGQLDKLERQLIGSPQPQLLITERLDQLEQQVFGKNYSGESVDTRLSRIQRQSTRQYAPTNNNPTMGADATPSRQNVQIGSGMDYNQSVTQRFSPEMMQMLPPNMQQPSAPPASSTWQSTQSNTGFGTGGLGWGRNTVTSQSSTVVLPQGGSVTTTEERYIPGYITPYGLPYSTTTTVPYGSPYGAPYIAPAAPIISTPLVGGGGMGTPMYGSSTTTTQLGPPTTSPSGTPPASQLQAIASLENRLYGRAQPSQMSATYRLQVMEQGLLGQTYDSLPTDQRIQQLQQAASQTNLALPTPKKRGLLGTLADTVSTALSGGYGTVQPRYGYGYGNPYATTNAPNSVIYPGYYYGTGLPQPAANAWGY